MLFFIFIFFVLMIVFCDVVYFLFVVVLFERLYSYVRVDMFFFDVAFVVDLLRNVFVSDFMICCEFYVCGVFDLLLLFMFL